jgi:hypothetical protein
MLDELNQSCKPAQESAHNVDFFHKLTGFVFLESFAHSSSILIAFGQSCCKTNHLLSSLAQQYFSRPSRMTSASS